MLANAVAAGGKVLFPKKSIGELGWVAELEDSEGNCIALSQPLARRAIGKVRHTKNPCQLS
jgi:predicted enzyme related to lactoylglutathione lyase